MAKVVYAPEADDDLESIVDYIARDKPTAAREWLAKIRETCGALASQPAMGEERIGFGDAAPNEAKDVKQPNHSTNASPRDLPTKACRRPLRQNHVE